MTVAADSIADVDVLANDTDPDGSTNEDLTVCRVDGFTDSKLSITPSLAIDESAPDFRLHPVLTVFPFRAKPGTYTVTYYVCDYDYLSASTLTVEVVASEKPHAEKLAARPGFVRFHNPGKRRAVIQYGSQDGRTADGRFVLGPRTARTVRIERHAIQWVATVRTRNGSLSYGSVLRGIRQPAGPSRTPSTRPVARTTADRSAWHLGTRQVELRASSGPTRRGAPEPRPGMRDESADAPLTAPDTAEVSQGYFDLADVLANDSDPDGSGDELAICRASAPARSGIQVTPIAGESFLIVTVGGRGASRAADGADSYRLLLQAGRRTPRGTYEITYYACDHQYLTPATVTVTVTRSQVVTAHKVKGRRGVVRFTNPGPHGATVRVRRLQDLADFDRRPPVIARFRLPAHTSRTVRVRVRQIVWIASSRRGPGGSGIVGGISQPPKADR